MPFYTLFLATTLNVSKELPIQSGLSLAECTAAATEALRDKMDYARCRPAQPEKPVVFLKLPKGEVVQVERVYGGYRLPAGHSSQDEAFAAEVLGIHANAVHSQVNAVERTANQTLVTP